MLRHVGRSGVQDYTLAEVQNGIENVVTGLRRELAEPPPDEDMDEDEDDFGDDDDDDDDDEDEDTSMEVDSKPGATSYSSSTTATLESTGPQMAYGKCA